MYVPVAVKVQTHVHEDGRGEIDTLRDSAHIYICPHISIYICMTTCQKQTLLCTAIVTVPCVLEPAQASTEGACVELQKAVTINLACTF